MKNITIKRITLDAILLASLIISAFVSIPFPMMSMTLQTLVVFLIILLSEGMDSIIITSVYAILGTVGLPVFAGFNPGSLASPTYGFIIAFIVSSILIYIFDRVIFKNKDKISNTSLIIKSIIFIITIYIIGLPYAMFISKNEFIAMLLYFLPYIAVDIVKIFIAIIIYKRLWMFKSFKFC